MLGVLMLAPIVLSAALIDPTEGALDRTIQGIGPMPGHPGSGVFIENKGQFERVFLFVARTSFGQIGLAEDGIYYHFLPDANKCAPDEDPTGYVCKVEFVGGSPRAIKGSDPLDTVYNYLIGDDPTKWATDVSGYRKVVYDDVWDGIDMSFSNVDGSLDYEIMMAQGADGDAVSLVADGMDALPIGAGPSSFDPMDMGVLAIFNSVALNFSTFFGGNDMDEPFEMDRDPSGNIYVTGFTLSENLPTTIGAYQVDRHMNYTTEVFVFKMTASGDRIDFCTYFGGSGNDRGTGIRVVANNDCIITGQTSSMDFPLTEGALDRNISSNSTDLFLSRISGDGQSLIGSTCIGGSDYDGDPVLATDESDICFIAAETFSKDFPITASAYQDQMTPTSSGSELVVLMFDLENMQLEYSTYLGGIGTDQPLSIEHAFDSIYVSGFTDSFDFDITPGAFQTIRYGSIDGFLFRFDFSADPIIFSTFFGGTKLTYINDIALGPDSSIYCCGETTSSDLPLTLNANDSLFRGGQEAFVFRINPTGSNIIYSTYFGGSGRETFNAIDIDTNGAVHLAGTVLGPVDHPLSFGALQVTTSGDSQAIYVKMNDNGTEYLYSTYIGGNNDESAVDVAWDPTCDQVIILGWTDSYDFPVKKAIEQYYRGGVDVFLTKFETTLPPAQIEAFQGIAKDKQVDIYWEPPKEDGGSRVLWYEVWRGLDDMNMDVLSMPEEEDCCDTNVINGKTYFYSVRAVNRIGPGPFSEILSIRPDRIPGPPTEVEASFQDDRILIEWNYTYVPDHSVAGYHIYKAEAGDDLKMVGDVRENEYGDVFFDIGVEYWYRITAYNQMGESTPSDVIAFRAEILPGPVVDLRAVSEPNMVTLYWDRPVSDGGTPIMGYRIYRAPLSKGDFERIGEVGAYDLDYIDMVENGEDFRYRVSAENRQGEGPWYSVVYGKPRGPPDPPRDPQIVVKGDGIELTWGEPGKDGGYTLLSYNIYRKYKDEEWGKIGYCDNSTLTFSEDGLQTGIVHFYSVTATNQLGESNFSETVTGIPFGPPGAPVGLRGNASDGKVFLNWSRPLSDGGSRIIGYRIYRGLNETIIYPMKSISDRETAFIDDNVQNGITYRYYVRAVNDVGEGIPSIIIEMRPIGLPSPPTNVGAFGSDTLVSIMWGPPLDDGGDKVALVRIYRGQVDSPIQYLASVIPETGAYADHSVVNGVLYSYYLTSVNSKGESIASNTVEAFPSGPPTAPRSVSLSLSDGWINIRWEKPESDGGSPITKYKVHRSIAGGNYVLVSQVSGSEYSVNDKAPKTGSEVAYWITAVNERGESPLSEQVKIRIEGEEAAPIWAFILILGAVILSGASAVLFLAIRIARRPRKQKVDAPSPKNDKLGSRASTLSLSTPLEKKVELPMDRDFIHSMLPCAITPTMTATIEMPPPPKDDPVPNYREYIDHMMPTLGAHPVPEEGIPGSVNDQDPSL
jgi:fibronectin type 3 domain-containing protein